MPARNGNVFPLLTGACDCHMHIYDRRFPHMPGTLRPALDAGVTDYLTLRWRLGLERTIVVTPSAYGTDNRVTLDAVRQLGPSARAVGVINADATDAQIRALHADGVRGARFNLVQSGTTTPQMLGAVAARIAPYGWHVQVHATPEALAWLESVLSSLPVPVVLDHFARIPTTQPDREHALTILLRMIESGRTWVKLSAPYHAGPGTALAVTGYRELTRTLVRAAPERLLWGSDWPHPSETEHPPDDATIFTTVRDWVADAATWSRILTDNPAMLYGF